MTWLPPVPRIWLYALLNVLFAVAVFTLTSIGGGSNPRSMYLIVLFTVCSTPIIDLDQLNGRFFLSSLYLAFYFFSFGFLDFNYLAKGISSELAPSLFSATEMAIVAGAIMVVLGSRAMTSVERRRPASAVSLDWPMKTVLTVGVPLWAITTASLYILDVYIIPDSSPMAVKRGFALLGPFGTMLFMLAGMLQPVGILLIAYAWRSIRSRALLLLVLLTVIVQVVLGFIVNIRSLAMLAGILAIVTSMLIDGRLPIKWFIAAVVYGQLVFPIFVASRYEIHGNRQISRSTILQDLGHVVELAIAAEGRLNVGSAHAQTLAERASVKASMQMIIDKTGVDVPFQHGRTLAPLLATFIPRVVWPNKPDIATGQVVNKEFHVSAAEYSDTYISPSIPGELYWNFGWPGLLIGMGLIGCSLGYLGQRYNLAERKTVTGLLVVVITTKQVIVGLEGTFSPEYVVWFRSLAAAGILHLIFARVPVASRSQSFHENLTSHRAEAPSAARPFPNLLS